MSTVTSSTSASGASQSAGALNFQQVKSDFQALSTALQSGDLSGAQQAYASLQKDAPALFQSASSQGTNSSNPLEAALGSIGSALQSGSLASAQQAFSSLQNTPHRHHHRGHGGGLPDAAVSTSGQDSSTGGAVSVGFSAIA